jgi:hypothetical protein
MANSRFPDSTSNLILAIQEGFSALTETMLWGKSSRQGILSLVDIKDWFREKYLRYKKRLFLGAVWMLNGTSNSGARIYQGIFDAKLQCIDARQITVNELAPDLKEFFNNQDLILFTNDKEDFYKRIPKE